MYVLNGKCKYCVSRTTLKILSAIVRFNTLMSIQLMLNFGIISPIHSNIALWN